MRGRNAKAAARFVLLATSTGREDLQRRRCIWLPKTDGREGGGRESPETTRAMNNDAQRVYARKRVAFALRVIQPAVIIRMPIKTGCNSLRSRSRVIFDPPPVMSLDFVAGPNAMPDRSFPRLFHFSLPPRRPRYQHSDFGGRGR
jgi:hypothetical protein